MSVSDPLIKDIKGCTLHFIQEKEVNETSEKLIIFCESIEKVFYNGLIPQEKYFYKKTDPANWIFLSNNSHLMYCKDEIKKTTNVHTKLGKFRLFIRLCLVNKCLHVPLEYLIVSQKTEQFYTKNSIIGDEILSQILLSVLRQISKIKFNLHVTNTSFLDYTWLAPETEIFEMVPSDHLGMAVSFIEEKAIIVDVKPNSVAAESKRIHVGDILDSLNGVPINSTSKGRLNAIFHLNKRRPTKLTIVKALNKNKEIFPPIRKLLQDCQINVDIINSTIKKKSLKARCDGYKAVYLGFVEIGSKGNVKQIDKAIRTILDRKFTKTQIHFEIGELGIKVIDSETNEIVLKHSYMQISSCGSANFQPNYFAYIASKENCDIAQEFRCFVFHANVLEEACTILQSIGQGFQRTHFAV